MKRAFSCCLLVVMWALAGCAWRTSDADHIFGPARYRFQGPPAGRSVFCETVHFPLLFEAGRQWGFTLGGANRLALVPVQLGSVSPTNHAGPPRGIWIETEPTRWHWSWLYLRMPLRNTPVFIRRNVVGAHGGWGAEERAISIGYSSITATAPRQEGVYELEFDGRQPLDARFTVEPWRAPKPPKPPKF